MYLIITPQHTFTEMHINLLGFYCITYTRSANSIKIIRYAVGIYIVTRMSLDILLCVTV